MTVITLIIIIHAAAASISTFPFLWLRVYEQSNISNGRRHTHTHTQNITKLTTNHTPNTHRQNPNRRRNRHDRQLFFSHHSSIYYARELSGWEFLFHFFYSSLRLSPISDRSIVESILDYAPIEKKKGIKKGNKGGRKEIKNGGIWRLFSWSWVSP